MKSSNFSHDEMSKRGMNMHDRQNHPSGGMRDGGGMNMQGQQNHPSGMGDRGFGGQNPHDRMGMQGRPGCGGNHFGHMMRGPWSHMAHMMKRNMMGGMGGQNAFFSPWSPFFKNFMGHGGFGHSQDNLPVNIYENNDEYLVLVKIGTLTKEQISLSFQGPYLDVKVKNTQGESSTPSMPRAEENSRKIQFQESFDAEKVGAKIKDGILYIQVPKEEKKPSKNVVID